MYVQCMQLKTTVQKMCVCNLYLCIWVCVYLWHVWLVYMYGPALYLFHNGVLLISIKGSTSKGGPVFSKLFRLDRTNPLSFGPKFPEILVEWIAPSESMVRRWRKDQANLFNGEIKLSAKRKTMGCFTPKYPELDQRILEWFTEQRSQGKFFVEHWFCILKQQKQDHEINQSADCRVNMSWMCDSQNYRSIMWQYCVWKILIGQFSQMSKQIQDVSNF